MMERQFTPEEIAFAHEEERRLINGENPGRDVPVSFSLGKESFSQDDITRDVEAGGEIGQLVDKFQQQGLEVGITANKFTGGEVFVARTREKIIDPVIHGVQEATQFVKDHKKEVAIGSGIAASVIAAAAGALVIYNRRKK